MSASPVNATPVNASTTCVAPAAETARLTALLQDAPASLGALFLRRVAQTPHGEAYRRRDEDGGWVSQDWAETERAVVQIAAGLLRLGLQPEERVALLSGTRVEWVEADLGVMCAGGATTTIYPTSTPDDVAHILTDSRSRFVFVEDAGHLPKLAFDGSPAEHVVVLGGGTGGAAAPVITLAQLRELGREALLENPHLVTGATAAVTPDQLATLIYTSGTTGRPKGVQLTHRNWIYEALSNQALGFVSIEDLGYLWLPMAHSFGKVLLSGQLAIGHAAVIDGDVSRIIANLPVVRPTVMPAVPRIFEKVHSGVLSSVAAEGGVKARLFHWAMGVGTEVSRARQQGVTPGPVLRARHLVADRLVLAKVRERFGGRIRLFISGSAPLSRDICEWFDALGLLVLEGYGLTETSASTFVNRPDHVEFGTVGVPVPGTEVAIAEDGEILLRGGGVMRGYHQLPEATAETIADGWLFTGDIGEITERGSLKITDRKKDLIKTSGGKYVAPQVLETRFKALCPLASQIVVHGEGRQYVTALIALDGDAARAWARNNGMPDADFGTIARSAAVRELVERQVEELNAGLGRWETIKKFAIVDRELSVEEGDLTPSLKLRRRVVERRHADLLEGFYAGRDGGEADGG